MKFLRRLEEAYTWKNFVGASPSLSHKTRDSCVLTCVATKIVLAFSTLTPASGLLRELHAIGGL
jgi:hypothetical protein